MHNGIVSRLTQVPHIVGLVLLGSGVVWAEGPTSTLPFPLMLQSLSSLFLSPYVLVTEMLLGILGSVAAGVALREGTVRISPRLLLWLFLGCVFLAVTSAMVLMIGSG